MERDGKGYNRSGVSFTKPFADVTNYVTCKLWPELQKYFDNCK